jgi:hypothetical protein
MWSTSADSDADFRRCFTHHVNNHPIDMSKLPFASMVSKFKLVETAAICIAYLLNVQMPPRPHLAKSDLLEIR